MNNLKSKPDELGSILFEIDDKMPIKLLDKKVIKQFGISLLADHKKISNSQLSTLLNLFMTYNADFEEFVNSVEDILIKRYHNGLLATFDVGMVCEVMIKQGLGLMDLLDQLDVDLVLENENEQSLLAISMAFYGFHDDQV